MAESTLSDVVAKLNDIEGIVKGVKGQSSSTSTAVVDSLKKLSGSITAPFKNLKGAITAPFASIKDGITGSISSISDAVTKPFKNISGMFKGAGAFLGNIGGKIGGLFKKKKPKGDISEIVTKMLGKMDDLEGAITKQGGSLVKSVDGLVESLAGNDLAKAEEAREQRSILQKIADGVSGGGALASAAAVGGGGKVGGKGAGVFSKIGAAIGGTIGGLISGIGGGFAKVGKNAAKVIKGAVAIAFVGASLIPAAKAFQMFSEVSWKGVGIGITTLAALVVGVMALGAIMSSGVGTVAILAGAAALAILGVTLIPVAKAFEMFGAALNEHVMPALRQFQPIINDFIDRLITNFGSLTMIIDDFIGGLIVNFGKIAVVVGDFIDRNITGMVTAFSSVGESIGGLITTIVSEISRLGALDGDNLLQVAAGVAALGVSLAAFGAGGAIGSIIGSISGAFGKLFGAESPIEQIQRLAGIGNRLKDTLEPMRLLPIYLKGIAEAIAMEDFADNLKDAADAFDKLMSKMKKGLNGLDTDKLITVEKIINLQGAKMDAMQSQNSDMQAGAAASAVVTTINNVDNSSSTNATSTTFYQSNAIDEGSTQYAY